jgi:carbonic anhydrase
LNSNAAQVRLNDGNQAFAALLAGMTDENGRVQNIVSVDPRDLGLLADDPALPKQRPFAAILGCSDARVPVELIFNEGPNDLFVVRVAGNGLGPEVLGSLKYAVEHLGGSLKLIVVLGHSGCGALTAAVDVFLNPTDYLSLTTKHPLRSILDGLLVVVQASAKKIQEAFGPDVSHHPGYRQALIEASIVTNSALAAYSLQQEFGASDPAGPGRIWRLSSRDQAGMGTACEQCEGNWVDRCAPRPGGIYRTCQRHIAVRPNCIAVPDLSAGAIG